MVELFGGVRVSGLNIDVYVNHCVHISGVAEGGAAEGDPTGAEAPGLHSFGQHDGVGLGRDRRPRHEPVRRVGGAGAEGAGGDDETSGSSCRKATRSLVARSAQRRAPPVRRKERGRLRPPPPPLRAAPALSRRAAHAAPSHGHAVGGQPLPPRLAVLVGLGGEGWSGRTSLCVAAPRSAGAFCSG